MRSLTPIFDEFLGRLLPAEPASAEELEQRRKVLTASQSLVGKARWVHMGREAGGVDCAGVLIYSLKKAWLIPQDYATPYYPPDYMKHRDDQKMLAWVEEVASEVRRAPRPGDVVLCQVGRSLSHCAIVKEWPMVIHAVRRHETVIEEDCSKGELRLRFRGVWSYRGWS
jgi:cell wall-associated NlpC family hydrolase